MAEHDVNVSGPPYSGDQGNTFFPDLLVLWNGLTRDEVTAFKSALEAARDEGDMQRVLEAHPCILIQHLTVGRRAWIIPKKRLGSEYETDFMIAQKASDGFVWHAVELERPQAKLFNRNGDPSYALNHALRQINDWRDWLSRNLDYAARPCERSGLGLIDIHPELEGLIIMGRDAQFDRRATAARRQRLERVNRVKIETYDWLLAQWPCLKI
jgi:Shedu protein SduA, C-terminal